MLNKKCYKYVKYVKYLKYMSNIVQHSTTFAPPLETLHAPPGGRAPQFKNPCLILTFCAKLMHLSKVQEVEETTNFHPVFLT